MDFGKLPSVDHVDFTLPPEPPFNQAVLAKAASLPGDQTIYIGATGYNMRPWVGKWYPAGTKDKDYLRHYGAQFNTIEHNTTHYRIPDEATVARWYQDTPADFRFCPKIPQTISHAKDLGLNAGQIELFCTQIAGLKEKLGPCFMQLPPYFSPRELPVLMRFLEIFPQNIPLAVEVRHEAFFKDDAAADDYFQLLQEEHIATVITDVSGRRDVCHMRLTHDNVLIRFVGNTLHPSDYTRISDWSLRLRQWFEQGLKAVYFFTHEPDNLLAPDLAAHCAATFQQSIPHVAVRGPRPVGGTQGTLF
jgi:uncharacterized protein YecE (DUF72 family)